jgi:hypothetical protein
MERPRVKGRDCFPNSEIKGGDVKILKRIVLLGCVLLLCPFAHADTQHSIKKVEVERKACEVPAVPARPSDAELDAYKVYHHARYLVQTAKQAGGTNKLLHTRKLPAEGTGRAVCLPISNSDC